MVIPGFFMVLEIQTQVFVPEQQDFLPTQPPSACFQYLAQYRLSTLLWNGESLRAFYHRLVQWQLSLFKGTNRPLQVLSPSIDSNLPLRVLSPSKGTNLPLQAPISLCRCYLPLQALIILCRRYRPLQALLSLYRCYGPLQALLPSAGATAFCRHA